MSLLPDAWRGSLREIDNHIFWIRRHRAVLDAGRERPDYLRAAKQLLAYHLHHYRNLLARVSRYEEQMLAEGHEFRRRPIA